MHPKHRVLAVRFLTSPLTVFIPLYLLYTSLFYNISINMLDEGFFVYNAFLIYLGKIPYRDFFLTTTPGIYYLHGWLLKVFGPSIVIDRFLASAFVILLLVTVSLLFPLSRKWKYLFIGILTCISLTPVQFSAYNVAFTLAILSFLFLYKGLRKTNLVYVALAAFVAAITFLTKQSIGGLLIPSFFLILLLYTPKKLRFRSLGVYIGVILLVSTVYVSYFFANHALSQMIYYTFFFASKVKSHESSFLVHRLLFIPLFILGFQLYFRLKKKQQKFLLAGVTLLGILYLFSNPRRIGRLVDYLVDPTFYVYVGLFIFPLILIALPKKNKQLEDYTMYSILLLDLFLGIASSGYSIGVITPCLPVLIPLIIYVSLWLKEKYALPVRLVNAATLVLILISVLPVLSNPFPRYAPAWGNYPLNSFTQSLPVREAALLRFNPTEKKELMNVISYVHKHVPPGKPIFCFPYCPMMYVLTERQGASFYSLFFFETFMTNDQDSLIADLEKQHPAVLITDRGGTYILGTLGAELEHKRLAKTYAFMNSRYKQSLVTENFILYTPK